MQSIINTSRIVRKPQKEVKLVEERPPAKQAEVVYVEPAQPKTAEMATQMEPAGEDWVLDAPVNEVEEVAFV